MTDPIHQHAPRDEVSPPAPTFEDVAADVKPRRQRSSPSSTHLPLQDSTQPGMQPPGTDHDDQQPMTPEEYEEEAEGEGAFNPETGEINWDCPCLGGMAHGPCGEEFKAAFSCFVYSKEEPKGMDCIDRFK